MFDGALIKRLLAQGAELLVTMSCGEDCPNIPVLRRGDWSLPDPKGLPLEEVRTIWDTVPLHVEELTSEEHLCK